MGKKDLTREQTDIINSLFPTRSVEYLAEKANCEVSEVLKYIKKNLKNDSSKK